MKYKAVIFDLFGTLVDHYGSLQGYRGHLSAMAAILSVPSDDFVRQWSSTYAQRNSGGFSSIEVNVEQICESLGVAPQAKPLAESTHIRVDFIRRAMTPRPDAVETMARLRAEGCRIGLISNCSVEVPILWEETPLASLVDTPIFSCIAGALKPDPRVYALVCQGLGVTPQDCLYVADGEAGELAGAQEAGMDAALIRTPYDAADDPSRLNPGEWQGPRVSALTELLALVL